MISMALSNLPGGNDIARHHSNGADLAGAVEVASTTATTFPSATSAMRSVAAEANVGLDVRVYLSIGKNYGTQIKI
jgi:hypothetical protein